MGFEYGSLSTKVYHYTKPIGTSIDGDIEYYYEQLKDATGKVLEAGCGTGRMLIPLVEKGVQMVGIDSSEEMLSICKEELSQRHLTSELYCGDLLEMNPSESYSYIIMPTGSIALLGGLTNWRKLFQHFYSSLEEQGQFIFDFYFPADFQVGETNVTPFQIEDNEMIVMQSDAIEMNWKEQYTETLLTYEQWVDGRSIERELQKFRLYFSSLTEMKQLLLEAGFSEVQIDEKRSDGVADNDKVYTFFAKK